MKPSLSLALALLVATSSPAALAAETAPLQSLSLASGDLSASRRSGPDPKLAENLSLWFPLGLGVLATAAAPPLGFMLTPPLAGIGHFYAGDPWRGTMWTLGGLVLPGAGALLGALAAEIVEYNAHTGYGVYTMVTVGAVAGGLLTSLGYLWFAGHDAADTAERKQEAL